MLRDNRGARKRLNVGVFFAGFKHGFRIVELGRMRGVTHFFHHDHGGFLVQHLVNRDHLAELHQVLNDFRSLDGHLVSHFCNRNGLRYVNVLDDGFGRRLEVRLAVVRMGRASALRTGTPSITAATSIAARLDACAALFGVILPGRGNVCRLDRFLVDGNNRLLVVLLFAGLLVSGAMQRPFWCLGGHRRRNWLWRLHDFARGAHHGLDLGHFISHGLAGAVRYGGAFGGVAGALL
jgi:hypothetical protein